MRLIRARNSKKRYYLQLRKQWAAKVSQIQARAAAKKSKDRNSILAWTQQLLRCEREDLQEVPLAKLIKKFLEKYLYWCMLRYSIAFFQWRRKFKVKPIEDCQNEDEQREATDKLEQLEEVFDSKIAFIRKYSHRLYGMKDQLKAKAQAKARDI